MAKDKEQPIWMPIIMFFVTIMKTGHRMHLLAEVPVTSILVVWVSAIDKDAHIIDVARVSFMAGTLSMPIKMGYATIMRLLPKSRAYFSKV
jgi:hypothetical protein